MAILDTFGQKSLSWDIIIIFIISKGIFLQNIIIISINSRKTLFPPGLGYLRLQLFHCSLFPFGSTSLDGKSGNFALGSWVFSHGWGYLSWPADLARRGT